MATDTRDQGATDGGVFEGNALSLFPVSSLLASSASVARKCFPGLGFELNHIIEFKWRPETMKSFFHVQGSATNSSLVKITVESSDGDSNWDDDLKFRINLNPEENPDTPSLSSHRMSIQLVGGKTSNPILSSLGNELAFRTSSPFGATVLHADAPGRSVSTQLPHTLLIDSVEDLLSGNREISQWAQFIDKVVDTRSTETVTHSANCREYRGVYTGPFF